MEGHGDMTLGHLSLRDPEGRGFWLKRNRIGLGEALGADDFVLVDWDGRQIAGSGGRHSEWPIHSEILRLRPDVKVVAHTHPFHACVFSASLEALQPFTLDADYFIDVPRHVADVALIATKEEGIALAQSLGDGFAVLMGNHGVTFCGASVPQAACVGLFLEKACKAQLAGLAAGFRSSLPGQAIREKRHRQIMTPVHWEHSWNYFCRKLAARGDASAIYG
jgi:ribulose-5-phosphate 4-epimerase/fuculose-1-phosphate aldolase